MKKFILTLSLVVFVLVYLRKKSHQMIPILPKKLWQQRIKTCCSDTKTKTSCSKVDNTASTKTASTEIAVAGVVKSEKSCCTESKGTAVASSEGSNNGNKNANDAQKKSCCSHEFREVGLFVSRDQMIISL